MIAWINGTFLITFLVAVDWLTGSQLPGVSLYIALAVGPTIGILGAVATPCSRSSKVVMLIATVCLIPIQFVIMGLLLLLGSGFNGIH